ncbi:MAG: hypothetical protein JWM27_2429 [Gemmatimonadetes bacterium]|nr:hypothetical protein [Gemmatimonadota bacterium]
MQEAATILGPADAVRKDRTELVRPTLLIGLGGTGREVLLRLRQRFVERYGVARLPATAFLWIDTDVDDKESVEGKPTNFLSSEAQLEHTEILDATVAPEQFMAYFRDNQQNQHIFSWIYRGVQKNGSIQHGARQVRPLGRLAFFHHAADIRRRIEKAAQAVTDTTACERMRSEFGIEVTPDSLSVIVVCSVAGGTGSGMFLDLSFMVRHLSAIRSILTANTLGYLVLPSVFAPPTEEAVRLYANGYAALKELEYYSMRRDLRDEPIGREAAAAAMSRVSVHDFVADWEARGPVTVVGPPFNNTFLVGNSPAEGTPLNPQRKGDLFDMIAENVFVDFSRRDFATKKRSLRSNLEDFLKNDLEYEYRENGAVIYRELFSYRFSTFGLSKLHVPVDRVRRACTARLGVDLMDRWLLVNPAEGDLLATLEQTEVEKLGARAGRSRDDLKATLDRMDEKGETFSAAVRRFWSGPKREELRERVRQSRPDLRTAFQREFDQYGMLNFNDPPEEEGWGQFLRRLRLVNAPQLRKDLESRLLARVHEWLNSPRVRLSLANDYLKAYNQFLGRVRDDYLKRAETLRGEARRHRERWERMLSVIDEEEHGLFGSPHRWSLRVLVDETCAAATRYFEARIYSDLYALGSRVCDGMRSYVGSEQVERDARGTELVIRSGLVQQLFTLATELWEVRRQLQARLEAFDTAEEHLVFTNLYRPGVFQRFYRLRRTDGSWDEITEKALRDLEPQLRQELDILSPYELLGQLRDHSVAGVRERVEAFCAHFFRELDEHTADAVQFLAEMEKLGELRPGEAVARLAERGNAWLAPSERAREAGTKLGVNYAASAALGISHAQSPHPAYVEFRRRFREQLGQMRTLKGGSASEVDTSADAVFFYTEIAGIPLAYIDRIDRYRDAYRALLESEYLHIDRHTEHLSDIVLKTQEEVRLAIRITRTVLLGIILNVLEVAGSEEEAVVTFVDTQHYPHVRRRIGSRREAQELLARDQNLLDLLEDAVEDRIRRLTDVQQQQFYAVLAYHVADGDAIATGVRGPFAERQVRIGDRITTRVSAEHSAVSQAMRELEQRIADRRRSEVSELSSTWDALFRQWFPRRTEYSREVKVGSDTLLVMRTVTPPSAGKPGTEPHRAERTDPERPREQSSRQEPTQAEPAGAAPEAGPDLKGIFD